MQSSREINFPCPLNSIVTERIISPLSAEIHAKNYLETLLYNDRYLVRFNDDEKSVHGSDIVHRLEYHVVDISGPIPVVLVGKNPAFKKIYVDSVDAQVDTAPSSSYTSLRLLTSEGFRNIISKPYILHDFIFTPNFKSTETPTSTVKRQIDGSDEKPSIDIPALLAVICVDFAFIDSHASQNEPPIAAINFYPITQQAATPTP